MNPPPRAIDRRREPRRFDGLQKIVDGVDLEGLDRVLIVRGDEHEVRVDPRAQEPASALEAGQTRHLNIEQHEVRRILVDRAERFDAICGLRDELDAVELSEQEAQLLPGQLLIVDDNCTERWEIRRHAVILAGMTSSGTTTRAQVPWPGTLSSCS